MTAPSTTSGVKRGTIPVFAAATAVTVSNIYFTQPLLERIAQGLGVSSAAAGIVATAGQIGYALGIVVIVPLADLARLRRISRILLAITALALVAGALALVAGALAPSIAALSAATFVLSVTTVLPQLIMPTVSSMAASGQAGRSLGAVGTGLTLGALLSRTASTKRPGRGAPGTSPPRPSPPCSCSSCPGTCRNRALTAARTGSDT
ncbi:hypothetical protein [Streptomyces sp. NPDC002573]|uniref:hypothetical protein n=1 Tax=Streptomyces sp. NPDC002573 TaxID=3364651 RepID=UPI0036D040FC